MAASCLGRICQLLQVEKDSSFLFSFDAVDGIVAEVVMIMGDGEKGGMLLRLERRNFSRSVCNQLTGYKFALFQIRLLPAARCRL